METVGDAVGEDALRAAVEVIVVGCDGDDGDGGLSRVEDIGVSGGADGVFGGGEELGTDDGVLGNGEREDGIRRRLPGGLAAVEGEVDAGVGGHVAGHADGDGVGAVGHDLSGEGEEGLGEDVVGSRAGVGRAGCGRQLELPVAASVGSAAVGDEWNLEWE